jgi:hypothetical protein
MTANMWFTGAYGTDYSASCFIYYSNSQLFLFNDDGATTTQSALGTAGSLANHQCSVDTGSAAAVWSGSNLTISLTVTFLPAFAGQLQTWMDINTASADTGWFQEGSWTATAPPNIVSVVSVKPCCNTSGAFQNFVFRYADSSGASNIQTVWFWFTPSYNNGNAAHTCQFYFSTINHTWNLMNDAGTAWMTTPYYADNLQNSQCALNTDPVYGVADTSDDYYTLTAGQIQFAPSFSGVQQIWAYATASSTNNSGWRQVGTYTVASPLQIDSVQPNSGTGQQQVFQVTVTDRSFVDNFIDLRSVDFLLNSTNSLAGGCWVHVVMNGSTMYLGSDSGVGYAGSEPIGVPYVSLPQNSQCTLNTTNSSVTYSSTDQYTLTFDIAVSFKAAFAGAKNIYVGIANPAWSIPLTLEGTWTAAGTPAVLQAVSASPSSGMADGTYTTFVFSDSYGAGDLTNVQVVYGTSTSGAGACWIQVNTATNTLSLANDQGTGWLGPTYLGSVSLQNSQCQIFGIWAGGAQGNNYSFWLTISFQPAFGGLKNVYGMANGTGGATSGWQLLGTWNTANPMPSNVSVSPNSGTGTGGTFTFTFSDTGGVGDLTYLAMLFGTPSDPYNWGSNQPSSCFITYNLSPPNFILQDDSGQNTLGGTPGSAGSIANSQCSLDLSHSTVAAGTNLVVTLAISFFSIYQGPLGIWMQAVDVSGLTPMQQMGSWTAASTPSALTLSATPSPSIFGQPVTLTATVSPTAASGRVTFYDGASILGGAAVASGTAALTTLLPAGTRSLRAYYSGDTTYGFSSAATTETVNAIAGTGFVAGTPLAAGTEPVAIAVADVNGDGRADLIVVNSGSNNVSVLLGNGSGGFSAAPGSPFTVGFSSTSYGLRPVAVAVGDFNGDGLPDLAVACRGNSSIWLLFGNGSGSFTPAQYPFAAGIAPDAIVAGDFNGDGKADLAIANQNDSTVSVFFGDGAGGFAQAPNSPIDVFSGPAALAVGDFNGDGNADLAVADATGNKVALLFGSPHGVLTISHTLFPASNPTAIAIGDFNGDGKTDLAYTNAGSNNVTVLLGDGSGGFNASAGSPLRGGFPAILSGGSRL